MSVVCLEQNGHVQQAGVHISICLIEMILFGGHAVPIPSILSGLQQLNLAKKEYLL
jgi:hypothetical protein